MNLCNNNFWQNISSIQCTSNSIYDAAHQNQRTIMYNRCYTVMYYIIKMYMLQIVQEMKSIIKSNVKYKRTIRSKPIIAKETKKVIAAPPKVTCGKLRYTHGTKLPSITTPGNLTNNRR